MQKEKKQVLRYRPCQYIHEIHQIHVIALSFIKTTIFLKYAIICMITSECVTIYLLRSFIFDLSIVVSILLSEHCRPERVKQYKFIKRNKSREKSSSPKKCLKLWNLLPYCLLHSSMLKACYPKMVVQSNSYKLSVMWLLRKIWIKSLTAFLGRW